jgi:ABC-2 type transport system permease protein
MRFSEIFRYELGYRLRSASTWLYGGFLFLLAFYVVHVDNGGSHTITGNAPFRVAEITALFCGLFGTLVTAALFADAALRDRASRMDPLLFTTRLHPTEYLGGRFLAALLVNAVLLLATPLGLFIGSLMPYLQREGFGPNHLSTYVQPVLLFSLPNLVLVGALLFTIAVISRHAIAAYLAAIAIFVGYLVAAGLWGGIRNPLLSVLADPLGINALKAMTKYWTTVERNVRTIGFPTMLLVNRVLWLGIAGGVLGLLLRTFRFTERFGRRRVDAEPDEVPPLLRVARSSADGGATPKVVGMFGRRTRILQTFAVMRDALTDIISGWPFRVAVVAAIALVPLLGWNVGVHYIDTVTWPVTHLVASVVIADGAVFVPWVIIALFAGELVWKDRDSGAAEIADAVPVRTSTVLLGRFLALVGIIVIFQFALMLGGMLLQALNGYYVFEPLLYARILFGFKLGDFILLGALAMTIHVLVNQKYIGHLLMIMVIVLTQGALYHPLFVYNSTPAWTYSEMNGFGPFVAPFIAFKLYWTAWALLFGVIALLFWARGSELGLRRRLVAARARLTAPVLRLAGAAIVLAVAFGGFIFYNTNILNEYLAWDRSGAPQAEYERRYSRYRDLPQPVVTAADLRIELYPEQTAVDMSGTYRLVNRTAAPIRTVHVETPRERGGYSVRAMSFDRAAKPQLTDAAYGYRIFELAQPLAPGESLQFGFDVSFRPRGFAAGRQQTKVVRNGSYFDRMLLPFIGYEPFEITDAKERSRYGLPPKKAMAAPGDPDARRNQNAVRDSDRIPVETVVGTSSDQTAIVPGVLRRSWTANGRRYFHYGTREPETFATAVFSAKYAVAEGKWNGSSTGRSVALQVFHHPPHRANVDRMIGAMKSALDYYTTVFGPYPYRELRIIEVPPYRINGRAFPSAMALAEQNFITRNDKGQVDLTFFGTAHETAHQWWGGQVRPAYAKGRSFVSESLANYSAMMVTEKVLGPAEARRVYDFQMERYLTNRAEIGRDVPLLQVDEAPYVSYGKGAVALYTLREQIGADAVNLALRRFLEKYRRSGPPYPTSLDLYAELRAVTPPPLYPLLTDLFETITLWDLKTRSATSRRLPDGRYEVTLDVLAQKLRADEVGREKPTPMNDVIEIGVFAAGNDAPIYLARHRLKSGRQTLKIVVSQQPNRAGIDPERKLIERVREDNLVKVTE